MALGCCVLRVASRYEQWFEPRVQPWVHFVPVAAGLSDLTNKVIMLRQTPELAERIAKAGYELAMKANFHNEGNLLCQEIVNAIGSGDVVRWPGHTSDQSTTVTLAAPLQLEQAEPQDAAVSAPFPAQWNDIESNLTKAWRWTKVDRITWRVNLPVPTAGTLRVEIPFHVPIRPNFAAGSTLLIDGQQYAVRLTGSRIVAIIKIDTPIVGEIVLQTPPTVVPAAGGNSWDERSLGLAILVG